MLQVGTPGLVQSLSIHLKKRADGSLSLSIGGDLQFDSRDERVYHETIVWSALGPLSNRLARSSQPERGLKVFIAGGGDGLCAREVLKDSRVESVTLVDYDARMLAFARQELTELNGRSLSDPRVDCLVMDAFDFAAYRRADGEKFDLIICDFTVPRSASEARLLSVDWFADLREILSNDGLVAINGVSPGRYSDAYWSIYNSLRSVGLSVKPLRVPIPSFKAAGFGPDWGFFVASRAPFSPAEFTVAPAFPPTNEQLRNADQWSRLFRFPMEIAGRRAYSRPTAAGSDLLITYLSNPNTTIGSTAAAAITLADWQGNFDFLAIDSDDAPLPAVDRGDTILPPSLAAELAGTFDTTCGDDGKNRLDEIIAGISQYMPAIDPHQSRSMVEEFLADPVRFIRGIDLSALVEKLLQRAAELPAMLVGELKELQRKLVDFVADREAILALGSKALAVIALIVILGNLAFVDNAYGKGGHGSFGHVSDSPGSLSRPGHSSFDGEFGPAEYATGPGFRANSYGPGRSVDETGFVFPARRYRYYGSGYSHRYYYSRYHANPHTTPPTDVLASYRLTPEADVLPDGTVVVNLTEDAFLQLGESCNTIVDAWTGIPICDLARDPAQTFRVCHELERQTDGLKQSARAKLSWISWVDWLDFVPWYHDDIVELHNINEMEARLEKARKALGRAPFVAPPLVPPPVADSLEVFASVWLSSDAKSLIVQRPEGLAYFDQTNWYADAKRTKVLPDYPKNLGRVVVNYYRQEIKDNDEISKRLRKELAEAQTDSSALLRDFAEYKACYADTQGYEMVDYGSIQISLDDAVARTRKDIDIAGQRMTLIQQQIDRMPREMILAQSFVDSYGPLYSKAGVKAGAGK